MLMEAEELTEALRIADDRMYLHKQRNHHGADRQSIEVLVERARRVRDSRVPHRVAEVADLAVAVRAGSTCRPRSSETISRQQSCTTSASSRSRRRSSPRPVSLTEDEWEFVRRHTLIGQRILASAPPRHGREDRALDPRALGRHQLPDRLAGPEIPLGARIISVCDAFDAMTPHRPYAAALTRDRSARALPLRREAVRPGGRRSVRGRAGGPEHRAARRQRPKSRRPILEIWAVSSVGEQGTLNPKVEGSEPFTAHSGAGRNRVRAFVSDSSLVWTSSDSGLYSAITWPHVPSGHV